MGFVVDDEYAPASGSGWVVGHRGTSLEGPSAERVGWAGEPATNARGTYPAVGVKSSNDAAFRG